MSLKNFLTNEELGGRFANQFQLVNYAINMAKGMVDRGEELHSNEASKILELIADNRELIQTDEEVEDVI